MIQSSKFFEYCFPYAQFYTGWSSRSFLFNFRSPDIVILKLNVAMS